MTLKELVEEVASHVATQTEAMERGRPGTGNRHAWRYSAALEQLRAQGEAGIHAIATLLTHPRSDVRTRVASYLLDHGYHVAKAQTILEDASQGQGLIAFGASQALKRWKEKTSAPASRSAGDAAPEGEQSPRERPRQTGAFQPRPHPRQPLQLPASLAPHRGLLEGALAPCIFFDKKQGTAHSRGCRYGGLPLLPAGTPWPRSPEGPLHFVGQLDFAELAACRGDVLSELPKKGLLAFFYDVENQPWGRAPADRAFWQLIYVPPDMDPVPLDPHSGSDGSRTSHPPVLSADTLLEPLPARLVGSPGTCRTLFLER